MLIYSLPSKVKRVVAGTRMADFSQFSKSGAAKGSMVYDLSQKSTTEEYPYVTAEEAWEKLEQFFEFSDIEVSLKKAAMYILQGRLRYVFGFLRALASVLQPNKSAVLSKEEKNVLFARAIQKHADDIQQYIDARWNDILASFAKEQNKRAATALTNGCKYSPLSL